MPSNQYTIDPSGTKKVILSVDGGGMRGAISIAMLAELEEQTGKTCQEMFDMVVGTSTGSIIAAGLAAGLSAKYILENVYLDKLPNSFTNNEDQNVVSGFINGILKLVGREDSDFLTRLLSNGLKYAYPLEPFFRQLTPLVGCVKIGDLHYPQNPILLVTTKDMQTGNNYFIVSAGKGKEKFKDWTLPSAVACSGAAPIFFPPVANRFVDGGVGVYSNPCLAAAVEAMEYISQDIPEFRPNNVILVSLGTGYVENVRSADKVKDYSALDWLQYVVLEGLDDAALQQVFTTRAIYRNEIDFRRYNPLLTIQNVSQNLGINLGADDDPSKLGLDSFKINQVDLMVKIGRKYAQNIDWSVGNVLPWDTRGGHQNPDDIVDVPADWKNTPLDCDP